MTSVKFLFGIEHEVAFLHAGGAFADFSNATFRDFQHLVDQLPSYEEDLKKLRQGDLGIKAKRWYVEGFERFHEDKTFWQCLPKGIEIRTPPLASIRAAADQLRESFYILHNLALQHGLQTTWISFNPFQKEFIPEPPLNTYEIAHRATSPEKMTATLPMLSFGPDLNLSFKECTDDQLIDLGKKLTYYSPFIVPFSFSSPFYRGALWEGYSVRTYLRTGLRPAVLIFLHDTEKVILSNPTLTKTGRIEFEKGRLEFKAFDTCRDLFLYQALLALLKGIILDQTLTGRAVTPNTSLHKRAALKAFDDEDICEQAGRVLEAAKSALADDADVFYLAPLFYLLENRLTPAHFLIDAWKKLHSINAVLQTYASLEL